MTVTNPGGCFATATTEVTSNTAAPENITLASSGTLTCVQTSVSLTAGSSSTGIAYGITGPEGFSASGPMATVDTPGTYTVTATGTNGCTATATTEVTGNTVPPSVTLTNSGPLSFTNTSVTLTATATPSGSYNYSFSPNAAQQGSSNKAQVTTAGVYSVTVTRQDNSCSATASTTVLGGNNPTVCRGGTAVINVTVEGDPVKYEWYKNSLTNPKIMETPQLFRGTATSSLTLINAQSNTQGNFYLKVTDRSGTVRVYGPYRLTVDASCRAREIASLETPLQVELAPNPIQQDRLRAVVRGAQGRSLRVELLDLSGKPIRQQHWQQADSQHLIDWDMQGQASGMYLLQVVSEAGNGISAQRQSLKVVKP
ncbi:T9SS type A sorting domain-containing protein [Spirosoma fluminis]